MKRPGLREAVAALVASPSISSHNPQHDQSNRGVIDLLAQWCETLGMRTEILPVTPDGRKVNLVARMGPDRPDGLVFSGHTDTVPFDAGRWRSDPFRLQEIDGRWVGLGVCDMKAFFAIVLEALSELSPQALQRPVTLVATADEESSMAGVKALADRLGGLGQQVVIGEPTNLQPIHGHKGVLMEEVIIEGRSGHSSDPSLGRSALDAMRDVLVALTELRQAWPRQWQNPAFRVPGPTLNFGCIHGGDSANRICGHCRLQFDVRLLPGMPVDGVRDQIRETLEPIARRHEVALRMQALFPGVPAFQLVANDPFLKLCEAASGQPGATVAFTTEAPFFQSAGLRTVVMGPGDIAQAHQPDEFLAVDRIPAALALYRRLLHDICLNPVVS